MSNDDYKSSGTQGFTKENKFKNFDSLDIPVDKYNDKRRVVTRKVL